MESHGRYIHRAAELVNRIKAESGGDAAIPGKERKWLIKAFATRAAIPALPIMEESKLIKEEMRQCLRTVEKMISLFLTS